MIRRLFGTAVVMCGLFGLAGGQALAAPDDGAPPSGASLDLAIGNLINTVGGDEAFADADLTLLMPAGDPNSGTGSSHFVVRGAHRTDFGSCDNGWATDTFDVFFHVKRDDEGPGNYTLVEQFKNGTFTTNGMDPSPGSCNDGQPSKAGHLGSGINGTDHGSQTFAVNCNDPFNPNCFNPNANGGQGCTPTTANPNPCGGTKAFCMTFFGPFATCTLSRYSFDYRSNNPSLVQHHWKDSQKNGRLDQDGDICQSNCGGNGEDAHGDGDVEGHNGGKAHFSSDEDGPKYGRASGGEQYSDPGANESMRSSSVDAVNFNDLTRVVTITGSGVNQSGLPVTFTVIQTAPTLTAPSLYSITISDGYTNGGPLLDGALSLF